MMTCATCAWFMPLSPGHAAICGEKWQHLEWYDAMPLTSAAETCDKHEVRDARGEQAPRSGDRPGSDT